MKPLLKKSFHPWVPRNPKAFRPPRQASWLPFFIDIAGGLYARFGLALGSVRFLGKETLAGILAEDRQKGTRTILAFRHCGDADPQAVFWALNSLLKKSCRRAGLEKRPGFLVLASAEIALWGGSLTEFMLKKAGTLPLSHGSLGRPALDWLRKYLSGDQDRVVVLAPEGQITYELDAPLRLDSGVASMVLWSGQDRTRVVPLGLRYLCPGETWERWASFMTRLERDCGLAGQEIKPRTRLLNLWDHLLTRGESYYSTNHRLSFPELRETGPGPSVLSLRSRRLTRAACDLACRIRGLEPSGDPRADNFRLRSANLELVLQGAGGDALERSLRIRACREAYLTNRHQELSDLLVNLDPDRLPPEPGLAQAVEAALNLADFAGRLAGGTVADRPRYFRRHLEITLGDPLEGSSATGPGGETSGRKVWIQSFLDQLRNELSRLSKW